MLFRSLKRTTVDQVMNSIADYKFSTEIHDLIVKVNSTANVESRYLRCVEDGIICQNLLDSYCDWSGDVGLFRQKDGALAVDVSTSAYFALKKLNYRLAIKLLLSLRFDKKLKLLLKVLLAKYKKTRSSRLDVI